LLFFKKVLIGDYLSGKIEYFENGTFTKIPPNFHTGAIRDLKYLPFKNGYVASASADKTVNVWDTLTWTSIQRYTNHTMTVFSLDQIDSDTMVSGSDDRTIQIWKISTGETLKIINANGAVYAVRVFSIINKQIVCGKEGSSNNIDIYNYSTGVLIRTLNGHSSRVWSIEMLSEQFMASGSNDKRLVIWDISSYSIKYTLTGHPNWVNSIKRLSSNLIASGDLDGKTFIWNWLTGERIFNLTGHMSAMYLNSLDLYDDQTLISGSADKTVKFWSISNGTLIRSINTGIQISALATISDRSNLNFYFRSQFKFLYYGQFYTVNPHSVSHGVLSKRPRS
jgi:WD40 repeat protein